MTDRIVVAVTFLGLLAQAARLAKPSGVTSTVSDRHAEQTVIDLVPAALRQCARGSIRWAASIATQKASCCSPTTGRGRSACSIRGTA